MAVFALPVVLSASASNTGSRIVSAGCVANERSNTGSRIVIAGCVVKERLEAGGGVLGTGCEAEESARRLQRCCRWDSLRLVLGKAVLAPSARAQTSRGREGR